MDDKESCQLSGSNGIMSRDEDSLLGEMVDNDKDSVKAGRSGKFLDEIHRD